MKRAQNLSVSQSVSRRLYKLYPLILFILAWLASTFLAFKYGKTLLDSDMASEMVLADLLNKEGKIISTNWYYSTEIRIIGQFLFYKPLLKLFPYNWYLVRTLTQSVLTLLTGISYLYLATAIKKTPKNYLFAGILICPFGFWNMFYGSFSGFYFVWIIAYTFCGGLILRYGLQREKHTILRLILLIVCSFLIGMQSIRGLMNLQLPMLLSGLVLLYWNCIEHKHSISELQVVKNFFFASLLSCLLSLLGYSYNSMVLSHSYSYMNQNNTVWQNFTFSRAFSVLEDFLKIWGYPFQPFRNLDVSLFSLNGILSLFGIFFTILVLVGYYFLAKKLKSFPIELKTTGLSCLTMLLVPYLIFVFCSSNTYGSYFLPGMGFYIIGLQLAYESFPYRLRNGKTILTAFLLTTVILSSINTANLFIKYPLRSNPQMPVIAELLEEQNYKQCVATFWNGNVVTELTNGDIDAWVVTDFNSKAVNTWLQKKEHINNLPTGRCAVIFSNAEYQNLGCDLLSEKDASLIYNDENYIVIGMEHIEEWWT